MFFTTIKSIYMIGKARREEGREKRRNKGRKEGKPERQN